MSPKIRRNDPCPCGSGLKYKKCCLARRQRDERRERIAANAQHKRNEVFTKVAAWFERHHEEALFTAMDEFVSRAVEDGGPLSEDDSEHFFEQAAEWALAEGTAVVDGREVRLRDLVLEKGPALDADQRLWFERSTEEPLRLWRVVRVEPGVGLELQNLLDESADPVWVEERSASRMLHRSAVIAARLGRWSEAWEIVAIYAIPDAEVFRLVDELEAKIQGDPSDPEVARETGRRIRDRWIHLFTRRPEMPRILGRDGDRIELTTDHWEVLDREELVRSLAAQPDVVGSADEGWTRLDDPDAALRRPLSSLELVEGRDRLTVFTYTRKSADEGRAWLESTAGSALRYLTREIVDPTSEEVLGDLDMGEPSMSVENLMFRAPAGASPGEDAPVSPETMTQIMTTFYRQQYANLANEAIPMLGDKSPRDLLEEPGGERKVRLWLEGFEHNEEQMAAHEGRSPVDLGFLWQAIGLKRDR